MYDLYTAAASEHVETLLAEANRARLVRLARCCSATRDGMTGLVERARHAGGATLRWFRHGQLAGYPSTCATC